MVHVSRFPLRLAAVVLLVGAVGCSTRGSGGGHPDGATAASTVSGAPTTAKPGTFAGCGDRFVDLQGRGVAPGPPAAVARAFAESVLGWGDAVAVRPVRACEVRLWSARARATVAVGVAHHGGAFAVRHASTADIPGTDGPGLSVALIGGHVRVYSGLVCGACTSGRLTVLFAGGEASVPVRPTGPVEAELDIPPTAVNRALLILLADAAGVARQAELVAVPDGDFAAS